MRALWRAFSTLPDRVLFGPASQGGSVAAILLRQGRYPYALLRDLAGGKLNLHAMGLVYASVLSVIPLVALSFGILKFFDAQEVLRPLLQEFFAPMGSAADPFTDRVMDFARKVSGRLVGVGQIVALAKEQNQRDGPDRENQIDAWQINLAFVLGILLKYG